MLFEKIVRKLLPSNSYIDKYISSVRYEKLSELQGVEIAFMNVTVDEYENTVRQRFPFWCDRFSHLQHKKLIEFYISYVSLNPTPNDVFMDAAGGIYTYINSLNCRTRILQDIKLSDDLRKRLGQGIEYLESNASNINLPDESVDKISCHHSFEHFQGTADIQFIKEIQRLLKIGGKCCIVPVFIADKYIELTDLVDFSKKTDPHSKLIIDPTATLPGGISCGNYARMYDLRAFQKRIINSIDSKRYRAVISEFRIGNESVPDFELTCHRGVARINRPYRALFIERFA